MMIKQPHYILALGLLALSSCTVGPDYTRPDDAAINNASAQGELIESKTAAFNNQEPPTEWWRLYKDKTLDQVIQAALDKNNDLKIALAHIEKADAYLDLVQDKRTPQTKLEFAPAYGRPSAEEYLKFGEPLPSDYLYTLQGGLSYNLNLFGDVTRAIEAADAEDAASRAAADNARITIVAETTRTYLEVCATGAAIDNATTINESQHQLAQMYKEMQSLGRATSFDTDKITAQEAHTHSLLPGLQARHKAAAYRLAALTGQTPKELSADIMACHHMPQLEHAIPTGDGRKFLQRRPDVRMAEDNLKASTALIGVATADLYPHISLGISGESTGLMDYFMHMDTFGFTAGPLVTWDFPNIGATQARIEQAKASTHAAYAAFNKTVLEALSETETALSTYSLDLNQNNDLRRAENKELNFYENAQKFYQIGRGTKITETEAKLNYLQAKANRIDNDSKILADQVHIFRTLGGGW